MRVLAIDLAGGANIAGSNVVVGGPGGQLSPLSDSGYVKLGIPTDVFTPVFAIARTAGWLAHWAEQMRDNRIFRPTQVYVGEHDKSYPA